LFLSLRAIRKRGRNRLNQETPTTPPPLASRERFAPGARNVISGYLKNIPGMNVFVYEQ